jgi:hypothetical protein
MRKCRRFVETCKNISLVAVAVFAIEVERIPINPKPIGPAGLPKMEKDIIIEMVPKEKYIGSLEQSAVYHVILKDIYR